MVGLEHRRGVTGSDLESARPSKVLDILVVYKGIEVHVQDTLQNTVQVITG